jgi:hypothetical protein
VRTLAIHVVLAQHLVQDLQRRIDRDRVLRCIAIVASARDAKRWNISPRAWYECDQPCRYWKSNFVASEQLSNDESNDCRTSGTGAAPSGTAGLGLRSSHTLSLVGSIHPRERPGRTAQNRRGPPGWAAL